MIDLFKYGNCADDLKGSGTPICDVPLFGDLTGFGLLKPGTSWNVATDSLDSDDWNAKVANLDVFPYVGLYNFEQQTPDNERATSSTGRLSIIRNGKPQYSVSFDKGSCLHKSLYDKRGNARWDMVLFFEAGILMQKNSDETELSGFSASMFDVETYKLLQGTDPEMSTAVFQLSDAESFNKNMVFLTWEDLGFNVNNENGVIDANIAYTVAPSASTTFSIAITAGCNRSVAITSLADTASFGLGGTQATPTAIDSVALNATTGAIDVTLDTALASGDTVYVYLKSADTENSAVNAAGEYYKGRSPLAIIS